MSLLRLWWPAALLAVLGAGEGFAIACGLTAFPSKRDGVWVLGHYAATSSRCLRRERRRTVTRCCGETG